MGKANGALCGTKKCPTPLFRVCQAFDISTANLCRLGSNPGDFGVITPELGIFEVHFAHTLDCVLRKGQVVLPANRARRFTAEVAVVLQENPDWFWAMTNDDDRQGSKLLVLRKQ